MATEKSTTNLPKLDQKELAVIISALDAYEATWARRMNTTKGIDNDIKAVYQKKAAEVTAVKARVISGELFQ